MNLKKKKWLLLGGLLLCLLPSVRTYAATETCDTITMTWNVAGSVPVSVGVSKPGKLWIDWGDGRRETFNSTELLDTVHLYYSFGEYKVTIGALSPDVRIVMFGSPYYYSMKSVRSLDVSGCSALERLDCSGNQLTSLNVSECTALTSLDCSNNKLTSLDVSGHTALTDLSCSNNKLTSLDVSGYTALTSLNCSDNQLPTLDVSGCSALEVFDFSGNNTLTTLNVSGCSTLTSLDCSNNQLTSLNASGCSALTSLNCRDNQLRTLDVSGCSAMEVFSFGGNNTLTTLNVSGCTSLTSLDYHDNQLTTLGVSGCTSLTSLNCSNNKLTSLDVSGCTSLTSLDCSDNHIPLSTLYNIYIHSSDWTWFRANPQSDSIALLVGEALDLSSEGNLGGNTTDVSLYLDDQDCPDDYYTENNFSFLFHRPNEYRLSLSNSGVSGYEYFDYYLSVKLPDGYFGIYVATSSDDMGTASISGNDIYQEGTEVTITATPVSGYHFVNWTRENGEVFSTEAEYTFTATENLELTANFEQDPSFTVSLHENNAEWGYTDGAWRGTYDEGEEVTIYASPYYGCRFVNWTKADGSVFSTEAEHTFIIMEDLELTANFEPIPIFTLSVHVNNSEWGEYTSGAEGTYFEGEEVTIYAYPHYGYHFVNWTKADGSVFSTEAEYTFIITEDLELTANFEQDLTFTLNCYTNNSEWGYVGGEGTYYEGTEVTIYASPQYGYHFVNWTKTDGSVFSTEAECTFIITEDLELTANFAPDDGAGNENHGNDHFAVYVQDRTIYLKGEGDWGEASVYNVAGQCIYHGRSREIALPCTGLYIVSTSTCNIKVMVY